ncbi:hypothetical protein WJX72_008448 [[Myrmecia] bisecta]|uniref:PITH domain-containing protein n=1 Tax=[Myrmecia] bisecta TaxID=41462 RepID=A0AAW1P8W3_9CHLO
MSGQTDMLEFIEWPSVECLNQQPAHSVENAIKQGYRDSDVFLESDTDEQLLIHIPFNTAVKLHSLVIKGAESKSHGPRRVKLFINKPSLGFADASDLPAVQEFELSEEDLEGKPLLLKFVKFQRVNVLTVFIEDNQGDEDTTRVQKIALFGQGGETMNVNEIKKVGEEDK